MGYVHGLGADFSGANTPEKIVVVLVTLSDAELLAISEGKDPTVPFEAIRLAKTELDKRAVKTPVGSRGASPEGGSKAWLYVGGTALALGGLWWFSKRGAQ